MNTQDVSPGVCEKMRDPFNRRKIRNLRLKQRKSTLCGTEALLIKTSIPP